MMDYSLTYQTANGVALRYISDILEDRRAAYVSISLSSVQMRRILRVNRTTTYTMRIKFSPGVSCFYVHAGKVANCAIPNQTFVTQRRLSTRTSSDLNIRFGLDPMGSFDCARRDGSGSPALVRAICHLKTSVFLFPPFRTTHLVPLGFSNLLISRRRCPQAEGVQRIDVGRLTFGRLRVLCAAFVGSFLSIL